MVLRFAIIALIAALLSGSLNYLVQTQTTIPMIIAAENYGEAGDPLPHSHVGENDEFDMGHQNDESSWMPEDGGERSFYTILTTIGSAFGYALMLLAAMIVMGQNINMKTGLFYGFLGFFVTGLAPSFGLPPQLPGTASALLEARQIWWGATACCTMAGLWFLLSKGNELKIIMGLSLMALPHVFGAPKSDDYFSPIPAEFASQFTTTSLMVHLLLWLIIGAVAGYLWHYNEQSDKR